MKNYNKTLQACCIGFIVQAITANFAPLLFLKFHTDYGIPLGDISFISAVFFFTQLVTDLFCARFVDAIGYRKCIAAAEVFSAAGLFGLAFLPEILTTPYTGILISVMLYAVGSGLVEVLGSPIVEACPFPNKDAVMSMLHSFYCWGSLGVILISSLFFTFFGIGNWRILACLWALLPLFNIYGFLTCPIEPIVEGGKGLSIGQLLKIPVFWVALILMICAGASEITMAQWASAYAESALGLSKSIGDLAGPCLFALTMALSRTVYGKFGDRLNLKHYMLFSGLLAAACYLLASLSSSPTFGLAGCVLCGGAVGIMWPGTISISCTVIPKGGTAMFALLAMAGDLGGTIGPVLTGIIAQASQNNLKSGLLAGTIFPVILILCILSIQNRSQNHSS